MQRLKNSILIKVVCFFCSLVMGAFTVLLAFDYFMFPAYFTSHGKEYEDTEEFKNQYMEYFMHASIYSQCLDNGFVRTDLPENYIALTSQFPHLYQIYGFPEEGISKETFDYIEQQVNQKGSGFLYLVENLTTGTFYYSPSLNEAIKALSETEKEKKLPLLKNYFETIQNDSIYLNYDTLSNSFSTNLDDSYYTNIARFLQLLLSQLKSTSIQKLFPEGNTSSYGDLEQNQDNSSSEINKKETIDTASLSDYKIYTIYNKESYTSSNSFSKQREMFYTLQNNRHAVESALLPVALIFLILFIFLIYLIGNKKDENEQKKLYYRIPTEIPLILISIGFFSYLIMGGLGLDSISLNIENYLLLCFITSYLICVPFLLLLIMKLKKKCFFRTSVTYRSFHWLFSFIRKRIQSGQHRIHSFFEARSITFRIVVFLSCCFATTLISLIISSSSNSIALFLLCNFIVFCVIASVMLRTAIDMNKLSLGAKEIASGDLTTKIISERMITPVKSIAADINQIGEGLSKAVDGKLKSERLKTELITNVSHDIKTPLTSIINYVDLLKKEDFENETALNYLNILTEKSWRLKNLIDDLVEASKASTGTLVIHPERLNIIELLKQAIGEFEDRFAERNLDPILTISQEDILSLIDGRSTYRIIENLFNNVYKYAMKGTRIYIDVIIKQSEQVSSEKNSGSATISIKNISSGRLNINSNELMERFVRGDISRNTEGSGLGLSIAKSLTELQHGKFELILDGDLFKVNVTFPILDKTNKKEIEIILPEQ